MGSNIVSATGATPLPRAGRIESAQPTQGGSRFSELLGPREQRAAPSAQPATNASTPGAQSAAAAHAYGPARVGGAQGAEPLTDAGRRLLSRISRGERFVEQVVHGASSGAAYTPADLLAIQAQVYRYTQEVELLSKFVDRATNTVKTVLQQGS
ncbi:MAG: hypothetical protein U0269_05630 [Polyangiales bacterium]